MCVCVHCPAAKWTQKSVSHVWTLVCTAREESQRGSGLIKSIVLNLPSKVKKSSLEDAVCCYITQVHLLLTANRWETKRLLWNNHLIRPESCASSFVFLQTLLTWVGPEIAWCRSWRLCVMWCVWSSWSVGASAKLCRCGVSWEGAVVDLLDPMIQHFFSPSYFFLMPCCPLRAQQNWMSKSLGYRHLSPFFYFSLLCEAWCIRIRCSTWSLHLWFRKPLTEAKDSLCGAGGNVDLYGPGNPHNWWLALAPSFPPHLFRPLTRILPLHCGFLTSFSLSLSAPHSTVLLT